MSPGPTLTQNSTSQNHAVARLVKQPPHDPHGVVTLILIGVIAASPAVLVCEVRPGPCAGTGLRSTAVNLLRPNGAPLGAHTGLGVSATMMTGGFRWRLR